MYCILNENVEQEEESAILIENYKKEIEKMQILAFSPKSKYIFKLFKVLINYNGVH